MDSLNLHERLEAEGWVYRPRSERDVKAEALMEAAGAWAITHGPATVTQAWLMRRAAHVKEVG